MKVIQSFQSSYWTRKGWAADGEQTSESILTKYPLRKVLLAASVTSWMKFAPEYERVLYIDQENYEILKFWGYEVLWDKVEVVNFSKVLGPITFYAATKPWTWTVQDVPFWSVDLDCYLISHIPSNLDLSKWYGQTYCADWDIKQTFKQHYQDKETLDYFNSTVSRRMGRTKAVNGGMIFCPNPDIAALIGLATLEIQREQVKNQWRNNLPYLEEIPLYYFLDKLGTPVQHIEQNSFFYHQMGSDKDKENLVESTYGEILNKLGYNPVEVADELSKSLKRVPKKQLFE